MFNENLIIHGLKSNRIRVNCSLVKCLFSQHTNHRLALWRTEKLFIVVNFIALWLSISRQNLSTHWSQRQNKIFKIYGNSHLVSFIHLFLIIIMVSCYKLSRCQMHFVNFISVSYNVYCWVSYILFCCFIRYLRFDWN